jgi:hypothetical protein
MATNTYVALDKVTLTNAAASATFSSISSAYTDLIIVANILSTTSARVKVRVGNGTIDTSTNYAYTVLFGNGTSAGSGGETSISEINYYWNAIPSGWSNYVFNFQNYSNTTTNKTVIGRGNSTAVETFANVGIWRATNAINIIEIRSGTGTFDAGSTFSLYGIRAEGVSPTVKATGGAVYSDDVYYYHVFGASGTFTPTQSITADILVVAGGGGGGSRWGGGGGAGGLLAFTSQSLTATNYTCTVGSGGAGGGGTSTGGVGTVGVDSQFGSLTLVKGGGFGLRWLSAQTLGAAGTGGSGGGATSTANGTTSSGGAATSGQGFAGGGSSANAAGGGGAGGAGTAGDASKSGNGGVGSSSYSSWGVATSIGQNVAGTYYLAGGGGGGTASSSLPGGTGGLGGGGNGNFGTETNTPAGNGKVNTGSGGGGAGNNGDSSSVYGGSGGSGVIIVRYAK